MARYLGRIEAEQILGDRFFVYGDSFGVRNGRVGLNTLNTRRIG